MKIEKKCVYHFNKFWYRQLHIDIAKMDWINLCKIEKTDLRQIEKTRRLQYLFEKIEGYLSSCKSEDLLHGYECVYEFIITRTYQIDTPENKNKMVMDLLYKEIRSKAKKYNNCMKSDRGTYELEVTRMLNMCEIISRHDKIYYNNVEVSNKIRDSWTQAEDQTRLELIGCICVQYNLPAGDPCWLAAKIGSY
jgi:hypothetical protein